MEKKTLTPPPEPIKIDVTLGYKSSWNYNSVSVNIGITDYVRAEENTDQALDRIYNYVESKVVEKMENTRKEVEKVYVKRKTRSA